MPPRFASPDRLSDSSACPIYDRDTRINYNFGTPENVPTDPVTCPYRQGQIACNAAIIFSAIQVSGMEHIANAQRSDGSQSCPKNITSAALERSGGDIIEAHFRLFGSQ